MPLNDISRRNFIVKALQLSIATAATPQSLGLMGLLGASQTMADAGDYKALVYVLLSGGNDSYNMIVPTGNNSLRSNYEAHRGVIALPGADLNPLNLIIPASIYGGAESSEFAMHPDCSGMAELFNNQDLSVICNTGNIIYPTSAADFENKSVALPPQLFSHSDQQRQLQSEPSNPFRYGWGGRMAELLTDYNLDSNVSPLIAVGGANAFQVSQEGIINTYSLGRNGAPSLSEFNDLRSKMTNEAMNSIGSDAHLMTRKYRDIFDSAIKAQGIVEGAFQEAESLGVDYDGLFSAAGAELTSKSTQRFRTVAKMIAGRSLTNNQRPVYFIKMSGFDTHQNLLIDHSALMHELSTVLKGFKEVLSAQGDFDNVLTVVASEFGRTFTVNGTATDAGTDHGWGGHTLVMGGMVNGGQLFGTHPDFELNQGLDVGRGRWIPTTSNSQCSAVMANWMGVSQSKLSQLFPSINNFDSPFDVGANLGFIG